MILARKCHGQNCWPERAGFSKLSLMGSLQAGKTSCTRLCPVMFIAWIIFISFDLQSCRFHSKHISGSKTQRMTHYKHRVYVFSVFADAGFSLPAPQPHQRSTFWPSTASGSPAQHPTWSPLADPCSILPKHKKNICFPIIFINYWHTSSISPEVNGGTGEQAYWISVGLLPK